MYHREIFSQFVSVQRDIWGKVFLSLKEGMRASGIISFCLVFVKIYDFLLFFTVTCGVMDVLNFLYCNSILSGRTTSLISISNGLNSWQRKMAKKSDESIGLRFVIS